METAVISVCGRLKRVMPMELYAPYSSVARVWSRPAAPCSRFITTPMSMRLVRLSTDEPMVTGTAMRIRRRVSARGE